MRNPTRHKRRLLPCLLVLLVGAAACGGDDLTQETSEPDPAVIDVDVDPGTAEDDFAGARDDVAGLICERTDSGWRVGGQVTNPLEEPADYRIYSSLLDSRQGTVGVVQIDVDDVNPGEQREWEGQLEVDRQDLECVLRVERVAG